VPRPRRSWAFPSLAAALLIAGSTTAAAEPLASKRADLDGDGAAETIEVPRTGAAVIRFGRGGEQLIPFTQLTGAARARIDVDGDRLLVVAESRRGPGEAIYARVKRGQLDVIERVALYVDDDDTDMRVDAALVGGQLYRYRRRSDIRRCGDGEPAWLETEKLDRRSRFVPAAPPIAIPKDAPVIAAVAGRPAGLVENRLLLFDPVAATSMAGYGADLIGRPVAINDHDLGTAWIEGRDGSGEGELVTFQRRFGSASAAAMRIVQSRDTALNRPKKLAVLFEGSAVIVELADRPGETQWVTLRSKVKTACATAVLLEVYPGSDRRADRTAIAELAIASELAFTPGGVAAALARAAASTGPESREAERLLRKFPTAAAAITRVIERGEISGTGLLRLRRVLAEQRIVPEQVAAGLEMGEAGDADRALFAEALVAIGPTAVEPTAKVVLKSATGREAALAALTRIRAPEALAALINLAGVGDRDTRRASALALGDRPPAELDQLVAAAQSAPTARAEADLWRAVGRMTRHHDQPQKRAAAAQALALALDKASNYELRYRLLGSLGALSVDSAARAVAVALARLAGSQQPRAIALRRVAAGALGLSRTAPATAALIELTGDPDPGVRERALKGLADRGDVAASDRAVIGRLETDPWPQLRRTAAGALSTRCARQPARAALTRAAASENDVGAGQAVLSALVGCLGEEATKSLLAVAVSGKRPTRLRSHAVLQMARIGGAEITGVLIELFDRFVGEAFSSSKSLALAQTTAAALCQTKDRRAVAPLVRAARQSAFPELQGAAARALGCFCAPETYPLLRDLARSAQVAVSIPARGAIRGCRKKRRR
jgi:HEAT repeat protein